MIVICAFFTFFEVSTLIIEEEMQHQFEENCRWLTGSQEKHFKLQGQGVCLCDFTIPNFSVTNTKTPDWYLIKHESTSCKVSNSVLWSDKKKEIL